MVDMTTTTVPAVTVDLKLAKQLTKIDDELAKKIAERNRLIVQAVAEGGSLREVAALVGLSHEGVAKILRRAEQAERVQAQVRASFTKGRGQG